MWTFRFFWFFSLITLFYYFAVPFMAISLWWKEPWYLFSYCWGTSSNSIYRARQQYLEDKYHKAWEKIQSK